MPLYNHIILLLPKATPEALTELFKNYSMKIYSSGGITRVIENHGIRPLPERTKTKYQTPFGKTFWEARYISTHFDVGPKALEDIERILRLDQSVIRFHTLRAPSAIAKCDSRRYDNPYLKLTPSNSSTDSLS